ELRLPVDRVDVPDLVLPILACRPSEGLGWLTRRRGVRLLRRYPITLLWSFEAAMKRKTLLTFLAFCVAPIAAAWAIETAPAQSDVAAGKAVAAKCSSCHGGEGIGAKPGVPHIAGQLAAYIRGALAAYQTGARKDEDMGKAVAGVSEGDLANLAAYYAS